MSKLPKQELLPEISYLLRAGIPNVLTAIVNGSCNVLSLKRGLLEQKSG